MCLFQGFVSSPTSAIMPRKRRPHGNTFSTQGKAQSQAVINKQSKTKRHRSFCFRSQRHPRLRGGLCPASRSGAPVMALPPGDVRRTCKKDDFSLSMILLVGGGGLCGATKTSNTNRGGTSTAPQSLNRGLNGSNGNCRQLPYIAVGILREGAGDPKLPLELTKELPLQTLRVLCCS